MVGMTMEELGISPTVHIEKIIFNKHATIVIWSDNIKTVVKCMDGDTYSYEQGVKECILARFYGSNKKLWKDIHGKSNIKAVAKELKEQTEEEYYFERDYFPFELIEEYEPWEETNYEDATDEKE